MQTALLHNSITAAIQDLRWLLESPNQDIGLKMIHALTSLLKKGE
jgi:hypothetical protein